MPPKKKHVRQGGASSRPSRSSSSDSSHSQTETTKRRRYTDKFKTLIFEKIIDNHKQLYAKWTVAKSKIPITKAWQEVLDYGLSLKPDCFSSIKDMIRMTNIWKRAAKYSNCYNGGYWQGDNGERIMASR
jgi:hypothetical protein